MARKTPIDFIRDQYKAIRPVVKADLGGKTVAIIGANVGIGFEAAKHFATMNPGKLILACRNQAKGQLAIESTSYYLINIDCLFFYWLYIQSWNRKQTIRKPNYGSSILPNFYP
jgi:hypothetical protein